MPLPLRPLLVVSYAAETREALATILAGTGAAAVHCASFCEAESLALAGPYSGMLVDLPSMIKSKGEEKIVAYTLANFYPTLRVRTVGSMLVPMAMPGNARQDKSLEEFVHETCSAYTPKQLRHFRRHQVCLPTVVMYKDAELRGFTLNISWGGAFIVDMQAERFTVDDHLTILIPEFDCRIPAEVRRIIPWGMQRYAPGIGLSFSCLDETASSVIAGITKTHIEFDRDRLSA